MSAELELESRVRCGLMCSGLSREQTLTQAREAESLGFDSLWAGDHISFHIPILDSLALLAFLAAATERITLGTAVYLLPLRHPTLVAKTTSTLDVLCAGRLVLGVGVGGEFPPEYAATGVSVKERGSRTDEAIPLLRRLWSEDRVVHAGRHFAFGPISLDPKPRRPGGPPIWLGGRSPEAMRRAGRIGDGYVSTMTSPERYRSNLESIAQHAREVGRAPGVFGSGALLFTVLGDHYERALAHAAGMLGRIYARPFEEAARKYCLLGKPEDCLEQMRGFVRAGVRHFMLAPLSDPAEFPARIARDVLPALPGLLA